jgi:hypothetical protein
LPIVISYAPEEPPRWTPAPTPEWTPAQAEALEELISVELRRTQQGSIEIEELLRRRIGLPGAGAPGVEAPSSIDLLKITPEQLLNLAQPGGPSSAEIAPSPPGRKGFWFRVNAELIIYGSTEPNAHVSIGGRPIRLREDGSFSFRFALPDGAYELPVLALSQDGSDGRAAEMRFSRHTQYLGEVGAHPQEAALKTPSPKNL